MGEQKIRIVHNLIGLPGARMEDIRRVYSHPQGLAQCARFLDAHPSGSGWRSTIPRARCATLRRRARRKTPPLPARRPPASTAFPCSSQGLETNVQNYTRFFVIARDEQELPPEAGPRKPPKASLCFAVADQPGALFKALQVLAERGLNMKKLESRPIHGKPWEYQFYVDVNVPADMTLFTRCMEELKSVTEDLRVLGTYGSG